MALTAVEEHWNLPALTSAVKALPEDRGDPSVLFDEIGDNLERLDDIGEARITAMGAQGADLQILSLAPPGTPPGTDGGTDARKRANDNRRRGRRSAPRTATGVLHPADADP